MPSCKHQTLDHLGNQKTDEGVNSYYKCRACGNLLVVTPSRKVVGIPGVQSELPASGDDNTRF